MDFKKAYDSVMREVMYSIVMKFGISMKLGRLIKVYLNGTYSKVHIGNHLYDNFPLQSDQTRRCFIATAFQLCFGICL
jgi:hypothetical protein